MATANNGPPHPTNISDTSVQEENLPTASFPSLRSGPVALPRKRQACDGRRPRCHGCTAMGISCEWTAPPGLTNLQAEKERTTNYESVMQLLRQSDYQDAIQVLNRLRAESDILNATHSIADAQLLLTASTSASHRSARIDHEDADARRSRSFGSKDRHLMSPQDSPSHMFEKLYVTDIRDVYVDSNVFVDLSTRNLPLSRWTTVSKDDALMNHLLNMFWSWDNVVERAMHRPIFEEDVISIRKPDQLDVQPGSFCSRFLVNAMLANGSLFSLDPAIFKIAGESTSRGRDWAAEAISLLQYIKTPSLPLMQGLYCLFVYEGTIGSGAKSVHYFNRAMETFRDLNAVDYKTSDRRKSKARLEQERQATSWCMWGFYCCEWRASQALSLRKQTSKPRIGKFWRESNFALSQPDCPAYWWIPYPNPTKIQISMGVEIREEDIKLAEIVESALDFVHPLEGGRPPVEDPQRALDLYDAFINWKMACPSRIRFEEAVLPGAILLDIGVQVMITCILHPFTHMSKQQFGRFDPKERCYQHANSMMTAIWTYRAFAVLRYEYWLTYVIATAAYIVLREADQVPMYMDTVIRACQCLKEMSVNYPLANDSLLGILAAFKRCRVAVPPYLKKYFERVRRRTDGLLDVTVAALLIDPEEIVGDRPRASDLQLLQLLDEMDGMEVD